MGKWMLCFLAPMMEGEKEDEDVQMFIFTVLFRQPSTKFYGLKKMRICRIFFFEIKSIGNHC